MQQPQKDSIEEEEFTEIVDESGFVIGTANGPSPDSKNARNHTFDNTVKHSSFFSPKEPVDEEGFIEIVDESGLVIGTASPKREVSERQGFAKSTSLVILLATIGAVALAHTKGKTSEQAFPPKGTHIIETQNSKQAPQTECKEAIRFIKQQKQQKGI